MKLKFNKFKKGDANVRLIILAFGAILVAAFFIYSRSMTENSTASLKSATNGLDAMVEKLNE